MTDTGPWRGLLVTGGNGSDPAVRLVDDLTDDVLMAGDVTIDVDFSSINHKDGLALLGRPGIVRAPSLIAGIDLVGTVSESDDPRWQPGDRVLVTGRGLGETHHGGLAERARVPAEWVVPVPGTMSQAQAAAIGTAGYTAMLAVLALEEAEATGDVLVTGATGGVGSIAIALLAARGSRVTAMTGRAAEHGRLRALGAADVIDRSGFASDRALQSQRWTGAVDTVGGDILATVLSQVRRGGTVAACGNAASSHSTISLMPFILRAVTLVGVDSVATPLPLRLEAWRRLTSDLDLGMLDSLTTVVPLSRAIEAAGALLDGRTHGRTIVDVRRPADGPSATEVSHLSP